MKRALTIGINDYPNAPLYGCVNDATQWAAFFGDVARYDRVTTLLNRDAKLSKVTAAIRSLLEVSVEGDEIAVTYSGHGTRVPCKNGDEADGLDEAWVLYDGLWVDDEIADLLLTLPKGVRLLIVSDSCHSGTVTRGDYVPVLRRPRCIPFTLAPRGGKAVGPTRKMFHKLAGADKEAQAAMNHLLLAGATPEEYSWDCNFNSNPWGALSYHALAILNAGARRGMRWDEFYTALKLRLPSTEAPQHPQLEGPESMRRAPVLSR